MHPHRSGAIDFRPFEPPDSVPPLGLLESYRRELVGKDSVNKKSRDHVLSRW